MLELQPQELALVRHILTRIVPNRPVIAFGSRVTGRARAYSDLDLAIQGPPLDDLTRSQLIEAFEESSLPFRVDISEWDALPDPLKKAIEHSGHPIVPDINLQG